MKARSSDSHVVTMRARPGTEHPLCHHEGRAKRTTERQPGALILTLWLNEPQPRLVFFGVNFKWSCSFGLWA